MTNPGTNNNTHPAMNIDVPIIFIHYGGVKYLKYTLRCARKSNPEKRIILLGDQSNKRYAHKTADFFDMENFSNSPEHEEYQAIFQIIHGERHRFTKRHGMEFWLRFVFRRWFLINEFLQRENIGAFWTFDSDTLVLESLASREARFAAYDATTQCCGKCLNGWVGSSELVNRYVQCILDQFKDKNFLEQQRIRINQNIALSFNEMDAFCEFQKRERVKTIHAQKPIQGEIFDDALALVSGFEVADELLLGRMEVKKLLNKDGGIFAQEKESGKYVRLLTCNMSWMPDFMWKRIQGARALQNPMYNHFVKTHPISYNQSFIDKLVQKIRVLIWEKLKI